MANSEELLTKLIYWVYHVRLLRQSVEVNGSDDSLEIVQDKRVPRTVNLIDVLDVVEESAPTNVSAFTPVDNDVWVG